jgi:hypothetical protein
VFAIVFFLLLRVLFQRETDDLWSNQSPSLNHSLSGRTTTEKEVFRDKPKLQQKPWILSELPR